MVASGEKKKKREKLNYPASPLLFVCFFFFTQVTIFVVKNSKHMLVSLKKKL